MSPSRRNVLIGIAGSAATGGLAFSTGAFSQVAADRTATVNVVGDEAAYLALIPGESPHAEADSDTNQKLEVDVGPADNNESYAGKGVNDEGITRFKDLFDVVNQGTQEVEVSITPYKKDGNSNDVEITDGSVAFYDQDNVNGTLGEAKNVDGTSVTTGNTLDVGLEVDTRGDNSVSDLAQIDVEATARNNGGS